MSMNRLFNDFPNLEFANPVPTNKKEAEKRILTKLEEYFAKHGRDIFQYALDEGLSEPRAEKLVEDYKKSICEKAIQIFDEELEKAAKEFPVKNSPT
jgi:hypothetical protein